MCDRFHCLPAQIVEEDADIIRMLKILALSRPQDEEGGGYYGE